MFKIKSKILKKLSAGFMAGLCAFSMLGSTMSGVITANAASTSTENSAFPSADMVIAKAATLLGSPAWIQDFGIFLEQPCSCGYRSLADGKRQLHYQLRR